MRGAICIAVLVAGCITDQVQPCGDQICPVDQVCVDEARCVSPDAVAVCDSAAAGAACNVGGVPGRCTDHPPLRVCDPAVCGDGVIDSVLHEECDGSAAFDEQCADLGFDLGRPSCASDCTFDTSGCTEFGWDRVVNASVYTLWTDGTVVAYGHHDPDGLEVHGGGWNVSVPRFAAQLAGGGGHIYAVLDDNRAYEVQSGSVVDLGMPVGGDIAGLAVDPRDGTLYATQMCNLWAYNGTWTDVYGSPSLCPETPSITPDGRLYFIGATNTIYELVAGAPVARFGTSGALNLLRTASSTQIIVGGNTGMWSWNGSGSPTEISPGDVRSIALAGNNVYGTFSDGSGIRYNGTQLDRFTPPTVNLADDGNGTLLSYGGPIYRYSGRMFGDLAPVPLTGNDRILGIVSLPDESVIAAGVYEIWQPSTDGATWNFAGTLSPAFDRALAGIATNELAIATDTDGMGTGPHLWRQHAGGPWAAHDPPQPAILDGLWMDGDDTLYAVGPAGFLGVLDGTDTWLATELHAECEFHGIDHGVAVGACDGVASVWRYSGGGWTEIQRDMTVPATLRAVTVLASGDIWAVGDAGAVWYTGGVWSSTTEIHGGSISGVADDIWVAGAFTDVEHWDGQGWSTMTTRALGPMAIAAQPDRVLMPGGAGGHVVLLR